MNLETCGGGAYTSRSRSRDKNRNTNYTQNNACVATPQKTLLTHFNETTNNLNNGFTNHLFDLNNVDLFACEKKSTICLHQTDCLDHGIRTGNVQLWKYCNYQINLCGAGCY